MSNQFNTTFRGHVLIEDKNTGEVLLDAYNAVHNKNMAIAIARGLSNSPNATIYRIKLGNGGSTINGANNITYQAPRVTGATADLYTPTYNEIIQTSAGPSENSVSYQENTDPATTTIVICSMTLSAGEPSGQDSSDTAPASNTAYAFDELGLFTSDNKLLTHIIFAPILKTANRELVFTYTLTVSVS